MTDFESFLLEHSARLMDRLRFYTPGTSQAARAAVLEMTLAGAAGAETFGELEAALIDAIATARADGVFTRLASRHRCMCYLDKRVDCWHADKPKTADHVVSFDWGGF